jgi:hypothetical protein
MQQQLHLAFELAHSGLELLLAGGLRSGRQGGRGKQRAGGGNAGEAGSAQAA